MGELAREARNPASPRSFALWFGALGPPLLWGAQLLLSDGLVELGCSRGFARPEIYAISLEFWVVAEVAIFLALDVLAGVFAYRAHRTLTREPPSAEPTPFGRAKAMAAVGVASAALYGLLILWGLFPPLVMRACERIG